MMYKYTCKCLQHNDCTKTGFTNITNQIER